MKHTAAFDAWGRKGILLTIPVVVVVAASTTSATTVSAGSGFFQNRTDTDTGSATWRFVDPTAADTISWTSGTNNTDGVAHAKNLFGPEAKFGFNAAGAPVGRVYAGFADNDGPGPAGSTTSTSGTGNGALVAGTIFGTNAVSSWSITATGALGLPTVARRIPTWESTATAKDPMNIFTDEFSSLGIDPGSFDLLFSIGLEDALFGPNGTAELSASLETTGGTTELINISLGMDGAAVTGNSLASGDVLFYLLDGLGHQPLDETDTISLAEIQTMLDGDASDGHVSDFYLGILLDNIGLTDPFFANGAAGLIHVDSTASDFAVGLPIPEPTSFLLLSAGVAMLAGRKRRNV